LSATLSAVVAISRAACLLTTNSSLSLSKPELAMLSALSDEAHSAPRLGKMSRRLCSSSRRVSRRRLGSPSAGAAHWLAQVASPAGVEPVPLGMPTVVPLPALAAPGVFEGFAPPGRTSVGPPSPPA
jgi:hypothetical protein